MRILERQHTFADKRKITAGKSQRPCVEQGCYNDVTLREQGAPEEFIRRAPICTPAEIGK